VVATAIEAAGFFNEFAPLILLTGGPYTSALPTAQLQALAYMPGELSAINYTIYTVFYGFDIIIVGYLVLRSTFIPRPLASCWRSTDSPTLSMPLLIFWHRRFAAHLIPWIQLPALFGEGSLCLWLLTGPPTSFRVRIVECRFTGCGCLSQPCHRFSRNAAGAARLRSPRTGD